jgi:ribosomal-protein-serine acetyltransferase
MDAHDITALQAEHITLHRITEANQAEVLALFSGYPDSDEFIEEIEENYLPEYDENGRQIQYGFYATLNGELAGMSLLSVDSWEQGEGSTGADTLTHMRGRGVAPHSKPHLFYFAFQVLGLHMVITGTTLDNLASKRSLDKTAGLTYRGIERQVEDGIEDDYHMYQIDRETYLHLYDPAQITVIRAQM